MNILQSFKMALKSILSNKMRSFLTMLGIIIGVASVIILVSVVSGYMNYMIESFADLGVDQISVNLINLSSRTVDADDMYDFYDEHTEYFNRMTPVVNVQTVVKNGSENLDSTSVRGYSEEYLDIKGYELEAGRNLSYADMKNRSKVCLIGYYVMSDLYGSTEKALGQTLKIGGNPYTIVGVVERQDEDELEEGGTDDFVWIPYTTATKLTRNGDISNYIFTVSDTDNASEAKSAIERYLLSVYKNDDLYTVMANSEMLDQLNEQIGIMTTMLGGIAGISLLVAGVGVMNIMLVSVTERTREIGVRKALGARQGMIMQQFVIEAAVTSSLGGVIGIVLGAIVTAIVGKFMGIDATPSVGAVLLSFSVSVGIGLAFGYMPAKRAAKLHPIDALRSD